MGASDTIICQLSTRFVQLILDNHCVFAYMACSFSRMLGGPCTSVDSSIDVFTVVLDRRCSTHVVRIIFYI